MRFLLKFLKGKQTLSVFGILLFVALLYFLGAYLHVPLTTRLFAIILFLFVCLFTLVIKQMKANRGASLIEKSIKDQADKQKLAFRPDKRGEIEDLKQSLLRALQVLKESKLGKGRKGKTALYALPWYIIIGPPAAGKTTAILHSGLEFPAGSDIKGVGGTRNCDWFFSNSAILLDTAGRYVTEDEDKEEWDAFLDILKKYRRKQPINGVIIGVSISDLVNAGNDEIEWHANNIRERIDGLIQRLEICFPVYLLFTKCDLIQGFVEIFENLNRKEREQIWGCTLSREEQGSQNPREVFEKEFDLLSLFLDDFRLKRLSHVIKPESRSRVFVFPLEFSGLKTKLGHFVGRLFRQNPYQENPIFRGFYFSSGTQEGVPIDRVIQAISKQFDLPPEMVDKPEVEKKSYFIKDLFTDVIFPDRNTVTRTSKSTVRGRLFRLAFLFFAVALLGAFLLSLSRTYSLGKTRLQNLMDSTRSMSGIRWDQRSSLPANFESLEKFRTSLEDIERLKKRPFLIGAVSYRWNSVLQPARTLYFRNASAFIHDNLFKPLEEDLTGFRRGFAYDREVAYNCLKSYLLMSSESGRLDEVNRAFLRDNLNRQLEDSLYPTFVIESAKKLKPLVERQIDFFTANLGSEEMPSFESSPDLVRSVRSLLYRPPRIEDIYENLKRESAAQTAPWTLQSALGMESGEVFLSERQIPGFFTKDRWSASIEEGIEKISKNPSLEDWVLGIEKQEMPEHLKDPERISEQLKAIYFREYGEVWWDFLTSVRYRDLRDLPDTVSHLKKIGDPVDSPLVKLLYAVTQETNFGQDDSRSALQKSVDAIEKIGQKRQPEEEAADDPLIALQARFSSIQSLFQTPEGNPSEQLSAVLIQFSATSSVLEELMNSSGSRVKDYVSRVVGQSEGDIPEAVNRIRLSLSNLDLNLRQSLFERPVTTAWIQIVDQTQDYLDSVWNRQVYERFASTLADKYPFNRQGDDARISDVEYFFNPQSGVLWEYINEELADFVDPGNWEPRRWEGYGLSLSEQTKQALKKAESISRGLFSQGQLGLRFRLQPDLPEPISANAPVVEQITLSIDGKQDNYRMGGQSWIEFVWPGREGMPGASLRLASRGGVFGVKSYPTEWGFFHLLDNTLEIRAETSSVFKLFWLFESSDRKQVIVNYRLDAISSFNPFQDYQGFFRFFCPARLNE